MLDYGADLSCSDDLDALCTELSGDNPLLVVQSIYRRLTTPRGTLVDDPDYGWDLHQLLHKALSKAALASIPGQIRNEITKDDRLESVDVQVLMSTILELNIAIRGQIAGGGPFRLVMTLTDAEVLIKEMAA